MSKEQSTVISDFLGLSTNSDNWKPGEAQIQTNVTSIVPGMLRGRDGLQPAVFAAGVSGDPISSPIERATPFVRPWGTFLVYGLANGTVRYARQPGVTIATPSPLTATPDLASETNMSLAWTATSLNQDGYEIWRSTDDVTYAFLTRGRPQFTVYTDAAPAGGTRYYYHVRSYSGQVFSAYATASAVTTLFAPSSMAAAQHPASETQVDLTWTDNSAFESGQKIEKSTDNITFNQFATPAANATSVTASGLNGGTLYYFRGRANNGANNSAYSNTASVTTIFKDPTSPTLTPDAASETHVTIGWVDNSAFETGYLVEKSPDLATWSTVTTTAANATSYSYTSSSIGGGVNRYYRISAVKSGAQSGYASVSGAATVFAPSGLTLVSAFGGNIIFTWTNNSAYSNQIFLYYSTNGSSYTLQNVLGGSVTTTTFGSGSPEGVLRYVRLVTNTVAGGTSVNADLTVPIPPTPQTTLLATGVSSSEVDLSWTNVTAVSDAVTRIYRSLDGITYSLHDTIADHTTTSYADTGLSAATSYWYKLTAYSATYGESDFSNVSQGTTDP